MNGWMAFLAWLALGHVHGYVFLKLKHQQMDIERSDSSEHELVNEISRVACAELNERRSMG